MGEPIWAELHGLDQPIFLGMVAHPPYEMIAKRRVALDLTAHIPHNEQLMRILIDALNEGDFLYSGKRPKIDHIILRTVQDNLNIDIEISFYAKRADVDAWRMKYDAPD